MAQSDPSASFSCCDAGLCGEIWMNEPTISMDLHTSCAIGCESRIQELLADGLEICDLDRPNKGGWTPLMYSSYIGHEPIVNLLLDNNVDVNAREAKYRATPLMLSSSCGNESVVSLLLNNRAKINAQDERGWTALFYATYHSHWRVAKALIDNGADLELRERERGLTPLLAAALFGHAEIFSLLLEGGANLRCRTNSGEDAQSLAHSHHNTVIVNLIEHRDMPSAHLRSEAGLIPDEEEWGDGNRTPVHGIHDGPEAFERLRVSKSDISIGSPSSEEHAVSKPYPISRSPARTPEVTGGSFEEHFFIKNSSTVKSATLQEKLMTINRHDSPTSPSPDVFAMGFSPQDKSDPHLPSVARFLTDLKLDRFIPLFEEKGIDFEKLFSFDENNLKEIGVEPFGPRRKLFLSLDKLRKSHVRPNSLPNQFSHSPTLQQVLIQNQELHTQLTQERELLKKEQSQVKHVQEVVSEVQVMLKEMLVNVNMLKSLKNESQYPTTVGEEKRNFRDLTLNLDDPVDNLEKFIVASSEKVNLLLKENLASPSTEYHRSKSYTGNQKMVHFSD